MVELSAYKCLSHRYFSADHQSIIRAEYIKEMERPGIDVHKSTVLGVVKSHLKRSSLTRHSAWGQITVAGPFNYRKAAGLLAPTA
jgi:3-dehydroquinate dehydratase